MKNQIQLPVVAFIAILFLQINAIAQTSGSSEKTREVVQNYLESKHSNVSMMADDVVFTNMATGENLF